MILDISGIPTLTHVSKGPVKYILSFKLPGQRLDYPKLGNLDYYVYIVTIHTVYVLFI